MKLYCKKISRLRRRFPIGVGLVAATLMIVFVWSDVQAKPLKKPNEEKATKLLQPIMRDRDLLINPELQPNVKNTFAKKELEDNLRRFEKSLPERRKQRAEPGGKKKAAKRLKTTRSGKEMPAGEERERIFRSFKKNVNDWRRFVNPELDFKPLTDQDGEDLLQFFQRNPELERKKAPKTVAILERIIKQAVRDRRELLGTEPIRQCSATAAINDDHKVTLATLDLEKNPHNEPGIAGSQFATILEPLAPKFLNPEQKSGRSLGDTPGERNLFPNGIVHPSDKLLTSYFATKFQSTGAVLRKISPKEPYRLQCSGTLIGCNTFLTAAHCVVDDLNKDNYRIFLPYGGIFKVTDIHWPGFKYAIFPNGSHKGTRGDIAILTLDEPVPGIEPPYLLHGDSSKTIAIDHPVFPARGLGYGLTAKANSDGLLRSARICTQKCPESYLDNGKGDLICWSFNPGTGSKIGDLGNSCKGDSGGPMFIEFPDDERPVLAAVTSGGTQMACGPGDQAYNTSVAHHYDWITKVLKDHQAAGNTCAPARRWKLLQNPKPYAIHATFTKEAMTRTYVIKMPPGKIKWGEVRIGFNGAASANPKFEFFVLPDYRRAIEKGIALDKTAMSAATLCPMVEVSATSRKRPRHPKELLHQFGFCRLDKNIFDERRRQGITQDHNDFVTIVVTGNSEAAEFQILLSWWAKTGQ